MKIPFILFLFVVAISFTRCSSNDVTDEQFLITYSDSGAYGENILDTSITSYVGNEFSFSANIPEKGDLTIRITKLGNGNWYIDDVSVKFWNVFTYDPITESQTFSSSAVSQTSDLEMEIRSGKYLFEFFENEDSDPTFTKVIEI